MSSIVQSVLEELERHEVSKVEGVDLVIGEMTFLGEDQLRFAYEIITKDTILEGSELNISEEPVRVRCDSCGYDGAIEYVTEDGYGHRIPSLTCPKCGTLVRITEGNGCRVTSLRVIEE